MKPQFVEKPEILLAGIVGCGADANQLDIGRLWQQFNDCDEVIKHRIEGIYYEMHIQANPASTHFCLVGVEVCQIEDIPSEMFVKLIPACKYAVFTHCLSEGGFGYAFTQIYHWLENSDYTSAYPFDMQCYDARFKGPDNPESVLDIYLPVVPW